MKAIFMSFCLATALVTGCISQATKNVALGQQALPDLAKVQTNLGDPVTEIKDKATLSDLVDFINSLPPKWEVPWYGPPVGRVYFHFYKQNAPVGNFYVGQDFFGRDVRYGNGFKFLSQSATPAQIDQLARLTSLDLRAQLNYGKP
jgi:hypothetical protein